jgi:lambda repressor-like predicted transcriptional regulator
MQLQPYEEAVLSALRRYGPTTVADLSDKAGLRVQSVSTTMTRLGYLHKARILGKARSYSTGAIGKLWQAIN